MDGKNKVILIHGQRQAHEKCRNLNKKNKSSKKPKIWYIWIVGILMGKS